jgi:hypothetical protein
MRNSCVSRPANRALTIIRSEDLEFTGNDHCAAALISYFEHWHNIRIAQSRKAKEENDVRELHGDSRNQTNRSFSSTAWSSCPRACAESTSAMLFALLSRSL